MPPEGHVDADLIALRRATAALVAAVNASDVSKVLEVWAADGMLMPPGHPQVHGRAALLEYFSSLFRRARFAFEFVSSDIELAADVAFERVSYTVTTWPSSGQSPVEDAGKGLHVYRRQRDGAWKLQIDIWNSDRPTGPP